jgi:hypothetical protein
MARLACLIVRTTDGAFVDAGTGRTLGCVAEGASVANLVEVYKSLRTTRLVRRGKDEVGIAEIRLLSNHTDGGELKAAVKFR